MTGYRTVSPAEADVTVLLTGAGAPGASGIVRSLRRQDERTIRLVGTDVDPSAYGFDMVDAHDTVPHGNDEGYVPAIRDLVARESIDVVLPLTTAELQPLANARESIDATIMVSDPEALAVANDKGRLYSFLAEHGFEAAPGFRRVETEREFRDAVYALGYPDRPVCFKRPVASGMRGFRVLDERTDRLTQLLTEKPDTAITTMDEVLPVLTSGETFPELVVMEYLPGEEYSVDALAMGDSVGPVVPRTRSRTRAGISFEGTVERREDLIESASDICRDLGLSYNVNLQFREDETGTPKVIEINPRVSGTIVMCVGAGANLPYLGVKHALGEPPGSTDVVWGTQMVRYWQELFRSPDGDSFRLTADARADGSDGPGPVDPDGPDADPPSR